MPSAADGEPALRLSLATLVAPNRKSPCGPWAVDLQRLVLREPVALPAATNASPLACAVALDGTALTQQEVQLLPTARRHALKV